MTSNEAMAKEAMETKINEMIMNSGLQDHITPIVQKTKGRLTGDTSLTKQFKGTFLKAVGANSESKLRSMPMRYLMIDECDVFPLKLVQGIDDTADPIEKAYRNTDVLCVPSEFEPFGICFAEAQFYGAVPVTFAGEGRLEAIKNNVTGVLVEDRTPESLGQVLIELLGDPEKIKRMSADGQKFARENFTYKTLVEKMLKVMESDRN